MAASPRDVRAPVSYGPRARAAVAYLLGRQHLPNRRVAETLADLFGLSISTGAVDAIHSEASRRLRGFISALVAALRRLPVLHADETTDRLGTATCWRPWPRPAGAVLRTRSLLSGCRARGGG